MTIGATIFTIPGTNKKTKIQIFPKSIPKVLRVYNPGRRDKIFVYDSNAPNTFIPKREYLNSISNKYDRKIKEAEIKKVVDW